MQKIIGLTLSILFGYAFLWPASSQAASEVYVITPNEGANLTMEPKENSPVLKKFNQGDRVEEVKQEGDWIQVLYEGKKSYIKAEHVKPLEVDLIAAYKHYAMVLGEHDYYEPTYYTLLYDFTQDGLEELYIVEPMEDNRGFRHRILSGEDILLDETFRRDHLHILSDKQDYFIVRSSSWFTGIENYPVEDLGILSAHEFVEAEPYEEKTTVIRSGSQSLTQQNAYHKRLLLFGFETNGEHFPLDDNLNDMINHYTIDDNYATEEQWEEVARIYEHTNNTLELFLDGYPSFSSEEQWANYDETVQKLYTLYLKYQDVAVQQLLDEDKLEETTDHLNYLLQTEPIANLTTGEIDYRSLFYMAKYYTDEFKVESVDLEKGYFKFPKREMNDWTYKHFGLYIDDVQLQEQMAVASEWYSVDIEDDYYITSGNGDAGIINPVIMNQHPLKNNYIALEYADGFTPELSIMKGESMFAIVKKINAADGSSYYPYITIVENLDNVDYAPLDSYTEALPLMQDHQDVEQEELLATVEVEEVRAASSPFAIIGGIALIGFISAGIFWRKRAVHRQQAKKTINGD